MSDVKEAPRINVYTLSDPRTGVVRYVGQTTGSLRSRLRMHMSLPTNPGMAAWISDLRSHGLEPSGVIRGVHRDRSAADRHEHELVEEHSHSGDLLNRTPTGGAGRPVMNVGEARTLLIKARITDEEKSRVEAHAERNGETVSDLVRGRLADILRG